MVYSASIFALHVSVKVIGHRKQILEEELEVMQSAFLLATKDMLGLDILAIILMISGNMIQ